jgi:hypothetical protein
MSQPTTAPTATSPELKPTHPVLEAIYLYRSNNIGSDNHCRNVLDKKKKKISDGKIFLSFFDL